MTVMDHQQVLIVGSDAAMLHKFHGPLIQALVTAGHVVVTASPPGSPRDIELVTSLGASWRCYPLSRTGMNPARDLITVWSLIGHMRHLRPDVTLCYTPKPVIYGTVAGWLAGIPRRFALVTGLGYAFTGEARGRRAVVQRLMRLFYRFALARAHGVMFQNPDDLAELRRRGVLAADARVEVFNGCGVDVEAFRPPDRTPAGPMTFIMVARLLADKGLREYAEAARRVRAGGRQAQFLLVGGPDTNPEAVPLEEVQGWDRDGYVQWLGVLDDVRPALARAHAFVLPSYREGLPQSAVEAMAAGLAVVTTDVPGCRETVVPEVNGRLVRPRDASALAEALEGLIDDPATVEIMGRHSRVLAETRFASGPVSRSVMSFLGLAAVAR